jgi:DNA-binding PadR family transcriptional regulator
VARGDGRGALDYCILGLVRGRPMSGYDIKRTFDRTIDYVWNAGDSQIYACLKRLSADGLVEAETVIQLDRPNKKVYTLTAAGAAALDGWLGEPLPDRFAKNEYLVKLFFCGEAPGAVALAHLEQHRATVAAQLAHGRESRARALGYRGRRRRALAFQVLALDYMLATLEADLKVTDEAIARLRAEATGDAAEHTA